MADIGGDDDVAMRVEWVDRIHRGDGEAEARFVQAYLPGIRVLVRKHCRPNDPALEDLVQDVLVRMLLHLRGGEVRDPVALPSYVRSLVANIVTSEYRRRARRDQQDGSLAVDVLTDPDNSENAAERSTRVSQVARLLGELSVARDREILIRHYVHDEHQSETCNQLGIDQKLYRRVLHRARERVSAVADRDGMRLN
ncbi:MAG: sigma-70 family RNA polymerase sigma factor [Dokdonella sp.]